MRKSYRLWDSINSHYWEFWYDEFRLGFEVYLDDNALFDSVFYTLEEARELRKEFKVWDDLLGWFDA